MMKRFCKVAICFVVFAVAMWGCREYEFPGQEYPGVQTLPVTDITSSGASFHADIRKEGTERVIDHGFIWGLYPNPQLNAAEKVSMGDMKESGTFRFRVGQGLYADTTYYVKAFVETASHTVFGKVVSFRSSGSLAPVIDGVTPLKGMAGDTLVITGRNFSNAKGNVRVMFRAMSAQVVDVNSMAIRCIVPDDLEGESVPVYAVVAGRKAAWSEAFIPEPPVVTGFSPARATFGETIIIRGSGFSTVESENKVRFNEYAARVVQSSRTLLKVVVPVALNRSESQLSVEVNSRTHVYSKKFLLLPPVIASVAPLSAAQGSTVTILGSNFSPNAGANAVLFGDKFARITSVRPDRITVSVPGELSAGLQVKVTVKVVGQSATSKETFTVK